jgi:hypothetical protein
MSHSESSEQDPTYRPERKKRRHENSDHSSSKNSSDGSKSSSKNSSKNSHSSSKNSSDGSKSSSKNSSKNSDSSSSSSSSSKSRKVDDEDRDIAPDTEFHPFLASKPLSAINEKVMVNGHADVDTLIVCSTSLFKVIDTIAPTGSHFVIRSNLFAPRTIDRGSRVYLNCDTNFRPLSMLGNVIKTNTRLSHMKNFTLADCYVKYGKCH